MLRIFCLFSACLMLLLVTWESIAEIKIAILDSGCNIEYEEGISFVDDTLADVNGHGTAIAGIIKEINPDAKLYIAKVFTQKVHNLDIAHFVKGIYWAISHQVDLINLSWEIHRDEKAIHDAIRKAYDQGIILVAAAGNKGDFLDALLDELGRHNRKRDISTSVKYPARYEEVIAVGAVNSFWRFNRREKYSPIGAEIEFVCDGSYGSQEGTSFAAARATAVIAKVKADYPDRDVERLRKTLRFYARDLGNKGRDAEFGYGKLEI